MLQQPRCAMTRWLLSILFKFILFESMIELISQRQINIRSILQKSMSTEIIKLSSIKNNLQSIFNNLVTRFKGGKNYDITLVIQQNQLLSNNECEQSMLRTSNKPSVVFNQNTMILNQDGTESQTILSDRISQPLFQSEQKIHLVKPHKALNSIKIKRNHVVCTEENESHHKTKFKHVTINNYAQTDPFRQSNQVIQTELRIEDSIYHETQKEYSVRLNNYEMDSMNSNSESSAEDNDSNAGFLIQKHLNQALEMIQDCRIDELEDFLYNYKEKYSFINIRTQTKWSLLMAHCKEEKLQYERAATNYSQVITNLIEYPRMLPIDQGEIYFKLGRCYYETRMWNKGVAAYTTALNKFKSAKKIIEYTNCIVSLGILYLEINHFVEAEKCFLVAYNIKRHEGDLNNRVNLLSVLFNLVDCNLNLRNYDQAEKLLELANEIILEGQNVEVTFSIMFNTKMAKLFFFTGKLELTLVYCQKSLQLLQNHRFEQKEYAQVLQLMGLLKQENGQYVKSRQYFEKALKAIQKYISVDSVKAQVLKKRISTLNKFMSEAKVRLSAPDQNRKSYSQSQGRSSYSDCFDLNFYDQ